MPSVNASAALQKEPVEKPTCWSFLGKLLASLLCDLAIANAFSSQPSFYIYSTAFVSSTSCCQQLLALFLLVRLPTNADLGQCSHHYANNLAKESFSNICFQPLLWLIISNSFRYLRTVIQVLQIFFYINVIKITRIGSNQYNNAAGLSLPETIN